MYIVHAYAHRKVYVQLAYILENPRNAIVVAVISQEADSISELRRPT